MPAVVAGSTGGQPRALMQVCRPQVCACAGRWPCGDGEVHEKARDGGDGVCGADVRRRRRPCAAGWRWGWPGWWPRSRGWWRLVRRRIAGPSADGRRVAREPRRRWTRRQLARWQLAGRQLAWWRLARRQLAGRGVGPARLERRCLVGSPRLDRRHLVGSAPACLVGRRMGARLGYQPMVGADVGMVGPGRRRRGRHALGHRLGLAGMGGIDDRGRRSPARRGTAGVHRAGAGGDRARGRRLVLLHRPARLLPACRALQPALGRRQPVGRAEAAMTRRSAKP